MTTIRRKSERAGRLYKPVSDVYKIERQLDAIQNHTRIALSLVRAYISCYGGGDQTLDENIPKGG